MEGLTEGRIVRFVRKDQATHPAMVVRVWRNVEEEPNGLVDLTVFSTDPDRPAQYAERVPYDDEYGPYTWHWTPRA